MTRKTWTMSGIALLVVIIAGWFYEERQKVDVAPLLETMSLEGVSFQTQWKKFRQKLGISEEARIEDFHLIQKGNGEVYSLRFRIVDDVDGKYQIYRLKQCFVCSEQESKEHVSRVSSDTYTQYPRLLGAERFFAYLDAGLLRKEVRLDEFPYYLITSSGEKESLGMPGHYYRLSQSGLTKMEFSSRPSAEGFNLLIIGSETPGPFSVDEKSVHLLFG